MDLFCSILPIVVLIYLMTKKNSVPSSKALPIAALLMYLVRSIHFNLDSNILNAAVLSGLLKALTPILIVWGAIFLFNTMEYSGAMDTLRKWLNSITTSKVGQLMIIGWAFAFLIEGASGFGTPAALAAPILVGLGFSPLKAVMFCLILNSVPVNLGVVGFPTWFGVGEALKSSITDDGARDAFILSVGRISSIIHFTAALVIPFIALLFVVTKEQIKRNVVFIFLSILSCTVPYVIIGQFSKEFTSLVGGFLGLLITIFLAKRGIGMHKAETDDTETEVELVPHGQLIKASFPIWGTILCLVITRVQAFGLFDWLTKNEAFYTAQAGSLGKFSMSPALILKLEGIFGTGINWAHKFLYVPSILPFILVSVICFFLLKMKKEKVKEVVIHSYDRLVQPSIALFGALVLVQLLKTKGVNISGNEVLAPTAIIGNSVAATFGPGWQYVSSYLGALGAFFSGSCTVSNLTFSGIQYEATQNLGLSTNLIVALQAVGGSMGNMICIHNIVAACTVVGVVGKEGYILKRTIIPAIVYGIIAAVMSVIFVLLMKSPALMNYFCNQ